jgi:hypothetical protein
MQITTKIVSCHTADTKPVKQEVTGTVILPPLVFPDVCIVMLCFFTIMLSVIRLSVVMLSVVAPLLSL